MFARLARETPVFTPAMYPAASGASQVPLPHIQNDMSSL